MSLFQKRHYEWLAATLRSSDVAGSPYTYNKLCHELADALARDNGKFDREYFIAACATMRVEPLLVRRRASGAI